MPQLNSKLWRYFEKDENTNTAKCKTCQQIFSNPDPLTELAAHLRIHDIYFIKTDDHSSKDHSERKKIKLESLSLASTSSNNTSQIPTITADLRKIESFTKSGEENKKTSKPVICFIGIDNQPISIGTGQRFQLLLE